MPRTFSLASLTRLSTSCAARSWRALRESTRSICTMRAHVNSSGTPGIAAVTRFAKLRKNSVKMLISTNSGSRQRHTSSMISNTTSMAVSSVLNASPAVSMIVPWLTATGTSSAPAPPSTAKIEPTKRPSTPSTSNVARIWRSKINVYFAASMNTMKIELIVDQMYRELAFLYFLVWAMAAGGLFAWLLSFPYHIDF